MNIINKLGFLLCFVGVLANAESVTPFNHSAAASKSIKDVRDINGDNIQAFLKNSAPVKALKIEPTPSPIAKLHNGPSIFLTLGVPASLADAVVRMTSPAQQSAQPEVNKVNFSGDEAPNSVKPVAMAAIKNPLLQNAASMTNAMPPAIWLLGFGLLGMAGISRRKKIS
jgi:hypothetical protein